MRFSIRTTLALFLLATGADSARAQTIVNGDFEDVNVAPVNRSTNASAIPGWTHSGVPGDGLLYRAGFTDQYGSIPAAGHGQQFIVLGGGFDSSGSASWTTTITGLTPGNTYVVSFMIGNEGETDRQSVTAGFPNGCSGTCTQTFTISGPVTAPYFSYQRRYWANWGSRSMQLTATGATATLQFSVVNEQYDIGIDYVTIAAGSPPAPQTAFAVPFGPNGPGPEGDPTSSNCTSCGPPVTVSNGNMYHQFTDLSLTSRGFPITLTRTYNSQAGVSGVFGNGWTHNYQRWLNPSGTSVVYYNESGGAYTFTAQGSGLASPPGLSMTLSRQSQGYQLQTLHGGVMNFDSTGRLTALSDANGNTQNISYNSQGDIVSVSDAIGGMLTFTYDGKRHIAAVQDNTGRKVAYQYDASGNLTVSADTAGAQTAYAYTPASAGGFLQRITFPDSGTINYSYDANKRVTQTVERGGAKNQYSYSGGQTVLQDELGGNTTFQFNSSGNVAAATKPDGTFTLRNFDANNKLTSYTDESGAATSYQYDSRGNLLKRTDALGGVRQFAYDAQFNNITRVTDANGNLTQLQYDAKGNLVKATDALGGQAAFTYDQYGKPLTTTDPSGATFSTTWDAHGNAVAMTDALGKSTQIAYDSLNRPVQITDALKAKTTLQYDTLGKLTQSTDPLGRVSAGTYDSAGHLIRTTDPTGATTGFNYDQLGNLTKVTDALGGVTVYAWSPGTCNCGTAGTLSSIANAARQNSTFTYDSNRRVSSASDAAGNSTGFSYDATGNATQRTDPNGAAISLVFDALHRVTQRRFPDGTTDAYTYDANGNMLTATNQNVSLTYTYDALNRVTTVSDSRFPAPTLYTYDKAGRRLSMTDPYGGTTAFTYDANGRLTKLAAPDGTATTFAYDANGRRSTATMGNGISAAYQRDAAGQLLSLSYVNTAGVTADQFSYTFDKAGNRLSMTTPAGVHNYQYDALYQLTGATHPNDPAESYGYDALGNRLSSAATPPGAAGTMAYSYDPLNRLSSVTLPDQTVVTYKYDAFGRRIEKNVNGVVTRYLSDGANVLVEQDDSGAAFRARYTYGPRIDEPLIMEFGGASYYYLADGAGNIVDLTDSTGATVQSYDTDSFGRLLSPPGTVPNPYVFAGRALDSETGLYYFRSRYYDAETGRFVSQDPFSPAMLLAGSQAGSALARRILNSYLRSPLLLNAYAYAANNPVNRDDPYGTDPADSFGAGVVGLPGQNPDAFVTDPNYVAYTPPPDLLAGSSLGQGASLGIEEGLIEAFKAAGKFVAEVLKSFFINASTKDSPIPLPISDPQEAPQAYDAVYATARDLVLAKAYVYLGSSNDPAVNDLVNQIEAIDNMKTAPGNKVLLLRDLYNQNSDILHKIGVSGLPLPGCK